MTALSVQEIDVNFDLDVVCEADLHGNANPPAIAKVTVTMIPCACSETKLLCATCLFSLREFLVKIRLACSLSYVTALCSDCGKAVVAPFQVETVVPL